MKKIIYLMMCCLLFVGCDNQLDLKPNFISETSVFEDESLTNAYLADLYQRSSFQYSTGADMGLFSAMGAEYINFANWQLPNQAFRRAYTQDTGPGPLDRWNWGLIRDTNYLLENIILSENLDPDFITLKIAEARFLRAYEFFEMTKRFGGIPILTRVQNRTDSFEELYLPRNKEQEVYDFIFNEIQDILSDFPDNKYGANGRVDKYTALMLQSRAMLYAGSIARNGALGENGITGIPSSMANTYYQRSYDASKQIIDSGMFSLINSGSDKVANYASIFLTEGSNNNSETIFAEVFEPIIRGHSLDLLATPQGFQATWNSNFPIIYDFVELFDFTDGRSGKVNRSLFTNTTSWDLDDFFGNRDPRFRASVFYPESEWQDERVWFHNRVLKANGSTGNNPNTTFVRADGVEMPEASQPRNRANTSLLLRKRLDETIQPIGNASGQDYIVYRYGETLLNYAEAAFYLNREGEALDAINQIRDRAGMPLRPNITEDFIRQERQVELCFEDHRYWDLIRWRIAPLFLDGVSNKGLVFSYVEALDEYVITLKNAEGNFIREFGPERYYLPFGNNRMADNPNFVQNPGY